MTGNIIIDYAAYWLCAGGILTILVLAAATRIRNRREREDELAQFHHRWVERS